VIKISFKHHGKWARWLPTEEEVQIAYSEGTTYHIILPPGKYRYTHIDHTYKRKNWASTAVPLKDLKPLPYPSEPWYKRKTMVKALMNQRRTTTT